MFQSEIEAREIMGVPTVFLNGERFAQGRMELAEIVGKIDKGAAAMDAPSSNAKEAFDVCSSSAVAPQAQLRRVCGAQTTSRTGVAAERFGGQVLDTVDIETTSPSRKPKARSSPPRWSAMCATTRWTS